MLGKYRHLAWSSGNVKVREIFNMLVLQLDEAGKRRPYVKADSFALSMILFVAWICYPFFLKMGFAILEYKDSRAD